MITSLTHELQNELIIYRNKPEQEQCTQFRLFVSMNWKPLKIVPFV